MLVKDVWNFTVCIIEGDNDTYKWNSIRKDRNKNIKGEKNMNYRELAATIIENVGGKENVNQVVHCATRLRFRLKDDSNTLSLPPVRTDSIKTKRNETK